jgi:hypothetical protein
MFLLGVRRAAYASKDTLLVLSLLRHHHDGLRRSVQVHLCHLRLRPTLTADVGVRSGLHSSNHGVRTRVRYYFANIRFEFSRVYLGSYAFH